jgi:hypothetical protein
MLSLPKKLAGKLTSVSAFERAANIIIEANACDRSRINLEVEIMKLEKSQWRGYFDRVSNALVSKRAEIEVASLKLGDRIEAEWLPLLGISYDPKNDVIDIALEGKNSLGETRRLDGHKEPSAPQNAPNIVKRTASRS